MRPCPSLQMEKMNLPQRKTTRKSCASPALRAFSYAAKVSSFHSRCSNQLSIGLKGDDHLSGVRSSPVKKKSAELGAHPEVSTSVSIQDGSAIHWGLATMATMATMATNQILLVPSDFGRGSHPVPDRTKATLSISRQGITRNPSAVVSPSTSSNTNPYIQRLYWPWISCAQFLPFLWNYRETTGSSALSKQTYTDQSNPIIDGDPVQRPLMKIGLPGVKCSGRGEE